MTHLPSRKFTASRWRKFDISVFGIPTWRTEFIKTYKKTLKKYCVGYIESENLYVRPKIGYYAVMFFYDDCYSWVHVTKEEFIFLKGKS